jgi:1,4-alpha-glucan branching enzyme
VTWGYTHVEIMPLVEHPLDASWGYQGTGYYSVTSRYGNIEGFKTLVNELHKKNIGVILDWVPGHFCRDQHGLYMFDGTPTYEYQEFWRADNAGWGTSNFDLGRPEVKSFLISNALYWTEECHIDAIRVDAVSNILYLDYGREYGQWRPNKYGDHGNLEGIGFIKELNKVVNDLGKNVMMIAEESTAWPNVCREEGLGFNLKWNMGWMNDVLQYVEMDPYFRSHHHGKVNFSMMYHYSENFVLPISHDEVVHGKKSLVQKMHGDNWNKFAGARNLLSYMMGHPGKKLSFMGNELGADLEWREYEELQWNLPKENILNKGLQDYVRDLNMLYQNNKCLWELDYDPKGFEWIDADNNTQSILVFMRKGKKPGDILIFVCNFTPIVHYDFKIGVPYLKDYVEVINSDDEKYGGSGQILGDVKLTAEEVKKHNQDYSISIKVPPMGTVVFTVDKRRKK